MAIPAPAGASYHYVYKRASRLGKPFHIRRRPATSDDLGPHIPFCGNEFVHEAVGFGEEEVLSDGRGPICDWFRSNISEPPVDCNALNALRCAQLVVNAASCRAAA